jgi:hypothetical protein
MTYPNIDDLFMEEMNNHNTLIALASNLQQSISTLTRFGLDIANHVSNVLEYIQRKEYNNAAKILTDAVYSIDKLAVELEDISNSIEQGVFKVYASEDQGRQELF